MTDDFFQEISNTGNPFEYADNVRRYQTQLPLGISWPTMTGSLTPRDLYSDDNSIYMYYPSGLNKTAIEIQQRDRFGGVTFTLLSGSVNLFIQASEYFADPNPAFISAPYTVSGESGTDLILASYTEDTPNNPQNYWINLPSPGTYKVVFPNPVVSTALTVTHSGSSPYIFSQMLPRKSVGGYDIDVNAIRAYHVSATLIDTIALQVADSIVVGPELIGAKSIDGSKIIDGTISGVLIRDGTVTGNKVLAGTISGVLLQGSTITGDKIVSNTITAVHIAFGTITGDKITAGTISGELITAGSITSNQIAVSGITAINLAANSITADNISVRTITADKIILNGITADEMAAAAVTSTVLANNAVVSGKVAASAIYGENIVGGTITGYHVAANTITAGKIAVGTITFNEIASNTLTADQIANGTLTGQKILDGTISGVLIREGTITGSKILANTISGALITAGTITATNIAVSGITADRLTVTQLDAVAANMGTLVVNSGITVGTDGYIWTGSGSAAAPTNGLKIYTSSGVSRLTTFSGGVAQVDIGSDGKLYAGSGQTLRLDNTGIRLKTSAISGEPLFTGGRVDDKDFFSVIPPAQNIIKFHPYNYTGNGTTASFTEDLTDSTTFFIENSEIYDPRVIDESGYLGSYARLRSGWQPTESASPMYKSVVDSIIDIESFSSSVSQISLNAYGYSSAKIKLVGAPPLGQPGVYITGKTSISGALNVTGATTLLGSLTTAVTLGVTGQTTLGALNASGAIGFGTSNNKVTIAAATGDTLIAGTLGVTGDVTTTENVAVGGSLVTTYGVSAKTQLSVGYDNISAYSFNVGSTGDITTLGALNAAGAIGFGTSNNKFTVASATGNTAIAGTLGVTGKITSTEMGYLTVRRNADVAITTAGTTIVWTTVTRSNNISVSSDTITIDNAGYYMFSATFATLANLTSLRMTLTRGGIGYASTLHGAGLSTGGGYIFNFNVGFFLTAATTYKVSLTPSANTTLNSNGEGFAGPSPILNIFEAIGVQ